MKIVETIKKVAKAYDAWVEAKVETLDLALNRYRESRGKKPHVTVKHFDGPFIGQ